MEFKAQIICNVGSWALCLFDVDMTIGRVQMMRMKMTMMAIAAVIMIMIIISSD